MRRRQKAKESERSGEQSDEDRLHRLNERDEPDEVGSSNGTTDGGLLVLVGDTLAGKVGSPSLRALEDDGRLGVSGGLEAGAKEGKVREQAELSW
jgi:hypothetical protein